MLTLVVAGTRTIASIVKSARLALPYFAGGSERSVVYRKGVKGTNAVCHGMPVGSGMILANGSVFLSRDAADDTTHP